MNLNVSTLNCSVFLQFFLLLPVYFFWLGLIYLFMHIRIKLSIYKTCYFAQQFYYKAVLCSLWLRILINNKLIISRRKSYGQRDCLRRYICACLRYSIVWFATGHVRYIRHLPAFISALPIVLRKPFFSFYTEFLGFNKLHSCTVI